MLTIECTPILFSIISKLDVKPVIEILKGLDIFDENEGVTGEKAVILGAELFAAIAPQLGKISNDIPELVALYKGITKEEANKLNLAEVISELINDEGIRSFFTVALSRRQKA